MSSPGRTVAAGKTSPANCAPTPQAIESTASAVSIFSRTASKNSRSHWRSMVASSTSRFRPFSRSARRSVEARMPTSFSPPAMQTVTHVPHPSTSTRSNGSSIAAISAKGFRVAVIMPWLPCRATR